MINEYITRLGKQLEHSKIVQKKLNCSAATVKNFCVEGVLDCTKVSGTWYVDSRSITKASNVMQSKQVSKQISLSKLRRREIEALTGAKRARRKIKGIEIRIKYEE